MLLAAIEATNFRNLSGRIEWGPRLNIIYGNNGQGKTNWLEAIYLLARTKSFRTQRLQEAIKFGEQLAIVRGIVTTGLELDGVTLAGESLGAALALSASIDLGDRVSRVIAFNSYDYPSGLERGNWLSRFIITSVRMPGIGPVFARLEPRPIMRAVLRGGFVDKTKLPEDFLEELLRSGRRAGYSKVARGIYRSLGGFTRARQRYPDVSAPVTLVYSDRDWSRPAERDRVASALPKVQRFALPATGHFSSLERPDEVARILLGAVSR